MTKQLHSKPDWSLSNSVLLLSLLGDCNIKGRDQ